MAFNFGAFLGGAAQQITKDIDDEEKRVQLRVDKILDKQQELTIQNQKEYKAKKEKVQNQMNALVPLFGGGPDAIAKARSIVAGGDNHFNFMFKTLAEAQKDGNDINQIYSLTPDANAVGFESVEDATDSLVTMSKLPEVKLGEATGMSKLFGIDAKSRFERGRKELESAGLLDPVDTAVKTVDKVYQTGKLNLGAVQKEYKTLDQMIFGKIQERNRIKDKSSTEYQNLTSQIDNLNTQKEELDYSFKFRKDQDKYNREQDTFNKTVKEKELELRESKNEASINKINAEIEEIKNKKKGKSDSHYQNLYKTDVISQVESKFDNRSPTTYKGVQVMPGDPDGSYERAKEAYKKELENKLVKNLVIHGLDKNGTDFIETQIGVGTVDKVKKQLVEGKTVDPFKKFDDEKKKKKLQKFREDFIKKYPEPSSGADALVNQGKDRSTILETLKQAYPNASEEDLVKLIVDAENKKDATQKTSMKNLKQAKRKTT
jgi:hypothetical protein